jgi:hypothetical protein
MFKSKEKPASDGPKHVDTRKEFSAYVVDISKVQRHHIADRVERLAVHESRSWYYFAGCTLGSVATTLAVFKIWGPRHIFKTSHYYARPIPVSLSMGLVLYGLFYTCRLMAMRSRIWTLIDDYEYELKRVKAHHVEEGVDQLAWLQFVGEQLRLGNERNFDIPKLRHA